MPTPVSLSPEGEITALLAASRGGDAAARDELFTRLYGDLKRLAAHHLADEGRQQTLPPTGLVHELYLRLAGSELTAGGRGELMRLASTAMRRILIDSARRRRARKRDGGERLELGAAHLAGGERDAYLVALDAALARLEGDEPGLARLVELRFFGGFLVEETAAALELSTATVKRRWRLARAWLHREISGRGEGE